MNNVNRGRSGFALPTVLVASIVLLMVLTVSVTSVVGIRTSLKTQYYEQLAKTAGEAGVEYAKACLAQNNNVPLWTDANPLRPGTNCSGVYDGFTCPSLTDTTIDRRTTDPRCWVLSVDTIKTSFSASRPSLDSDGRAVAVANSGYVELIRSSNGAVWRRYSQPSVQATVVPELCSGATKSSLGWRNASYSGATVAVANASSARAISESTSPSTSYAGKAYFRKDFNINEAGSYALYFKTTPSATVQIYIDGTLRLSTGPGGATSTVALTPGCHSITAVVSSDTLEAQDTAVAGAIKAAVATATMAPIVITDSSWRVSNGDVVSFSDPEYVTSPSAWSVVRDVNAASLTPTSDWATRSGDQFARLISTTHNNSSGNYPANRYAMFRANEPITISADTEVKVTAACDDVCSVFMNGARVNSSASSTVNAVTSTLTPGVYQFGALVYNGGSTANPSGMALSVVRTSDNTTLQRTDNRWLATTTWSTGFGNIYSYADSFRPSPNQVKDPVVVDALVVAGGGGASGNGGAGGGGGGVRIIKDIAIASTGARTVVVGAGGAGAGDGAVGARGANSYFASSTGYQAIGGGGGGPRLVNVNNPISPTTGGSGGGGGTGGSSAAGSSSLGAAGTAGHGGNGGNGNTGDGGANASTRRGGGGGGAGGNGGDGVTSGLSGNGGAGVTTYFTNVRTAYGGGGSGIGTSVAAAGAATNGGGGGSGVAGLAGTGGGGGASFTATGGAGGSGFVAIRYKTGTLVATGGTISTFGEYTLHRFTSVGTFTFNVTSIP